MSTSYMHNNSYVNYKIGNIPNTSLMYIIYSDTRALLITENLKVIEDCFIYISHLNNMKTISRCLGFKYVIDVSKLYPKNNFDFSEYKLTNIYYEPMRSDPTWFFSGHIGFMIRIPTLNSMKHYTTYHTTFHKYKLIHTTLCLDITNYIFQIIMIVEIEEYYCTKLINIGNKIDDKFKHKFINAIYDVSHLNI